MKITFNVQQKAKKTPFHLSECTSATTTDKTVANTWPSKKFKTRFIGQFINILQCHIIANWTFYSTQPSWASQLECWIIRWKFISICYSQWVYCFTSERVCVHSALHRQESQLNDVCCKFIVTLTPSGSVETKTKSLFRPHRPVRHAPVINSNHIAEWMRISTHSAKWIL